MTTPTLRIAIFSLGLPAVSCGSSAAGDDSTAPSEVGNTAGRASGAGGGTADNRGATIAAGGGAGTPGGAGGATGDAGGAGRDAGGAGRAAGGSGGGAAGGTAEGGVPVVAGPCDSLPEKGKWQDITPAGYDLAASYVGTEAIVIRPDNPSIVFVGAEHAGVYRSDDCGANWKIVATGMNAAHLKTGTPWSLVLDPVTPDVMYTALGYGDSGLWKTTNAGTDWAQVFTQNVTDAFSSHGQITGIALDPSDHMHVVAESHGTGAGQCAGMTCIAESTDGGTSWTIRTIPQEWSENSSVVIISRKVWLYTALFGGLWATTDEGVSWKKLSSAYATANYYEPHIWQDAAGAFYLPTIQTGMQKSSPNDPLTWTAIAGSPNATVLWATGKSLIVGSEFDTHFYIASQSDTSKWTAFPGPDHPANSQRGASAYMNYDPVHHILYSGDMNQGLWRIVID